jgi:hypothetical protein
MALHKLNYQPARTRVEQGSTRFAKCSSLQTALHCTLLAFVTALQSRGRKHVQADSQRVS